MSADDKTTIDAYQSGWSKIMNLIQTGGSWSGHERNCCFLNTGQTRFANVSGVSGLDFPDDGRCVAPVDWDHDGDLDLWLSARTGPTLRFVRNNGTDHHHFVAFKLQGTSSNRDAVGARIELTSGTQTLLRTVHAGDGYLTQTSKWIHFGLGTSDAVDRVVVKWPGGETEVFAGVTGNQQFRLLQGTGMAEPWTPPKRTVALTPSRLDTVKSERARRVVVRDRVPMANLQYQNFAGEDFAIPGPSVGPILVNLWATWCAPCLTELKEFAENEEQLKNLGLDIVALNVEAASGGNDGVTQQAREFMIKKLAFPFRSGMADSTLLDKLDAMQETLISLRAAPGQLPSSFLIDRFGRLAVIYPGPVSVEQLINDVKSLSASAEAARDRFLPLGGRWINEPDRSSHVLVSLSKEFRKRGLQDEALRFGSLAADVSSRHNVLAEESHELASMFFDAGVSQLQAEKPHEALRYLLEAVRMRPDWAEAHTNLGNAYNLLGRTQLATGHLIHALQRKPDLIYAHLNLGLIYLQQDNLNSAAQHFQATVQIQPGFSEGHHQLGIALIRLGHRQQGIAELKQAVLIDSGNTAAKASLNQAMTGQRP